MSVRGQNTGAWLGPTPRLRERLPLSVALDLRMGCGQFKIIYQENVCWMENYG